MSSMEIRHEGSQVQLTLRGALTIAEASSTHAELCQHLSGVDLGGAPVRLDASELGEIDSAGIQLLVSTALHVRSVGGQPVLTAAASVLGRVAKVLGAADARSCCGFVIEAAKKAEEGVLA
jgi:anti-anti-sigma regulatory factor